MHQAHDAAIAPSSRLMIRCSIAVFTAAVLLFSQSVFWTSAVSAWMRLILVAVALVSYFRPQAGLLFLAAMIPLGQISSRTLGYQMRGGEALVLAFLAGALMRSWTLHRFRNFPSDHLHIAALFLGMVVAASCIEQIWFLQIRRHYAASFPGDLLTYGTQYYLTSFRGFQTIFRAMVLIEGLALLLYVSHYSRTRPGFSVAAVRMLAAGATAVALVSVAFVWSEFLQTGEPLSQLWRFLEGKRWVAHVGDINAAGSFFVFAALLLVSVGLFGAGRPLPWVALAFLSGLVMWTTASRTAIVAFLLVGGCVLVKHVLTRPRVFSLTLGIAAAGLGALAIWRFPVQLAGSIAWEGAAFRWSFLKTTLRMVAAQPLFGVGVGQYAVWSSRFIPAELIGSPYATENAHNNFAQIAGELGLLGFVAFVSVLAVAVMALRERRSRENPLAMALLAGIAAFMVTWFGGHPLLVPETAYPFWIALGVLAGILPSPARLGRKSIAVFGLATVVVMGSIPWRVIDKQQNLMNLPEVSEESP